MEKDELALWIALASLFVAIVSACFTGWMAFLNWRRHQREIEAARRAIEAENPSLTLMMQPYDCTGYVWRAVVRVKNQSLHIVKDIEFRILSKPLGGWEVATVEITPKPDALEGMISVDLQYVASSKRSVVIGPKDEGEAFFYFMVERDGSYKRVFEIAYVLQHGIEERRVVRLKRRIDMPPAGYSNPLIPPRESERYLGH
jgi:hypothetical protein